MYSLYISRHQLLYPYISFMPPFCSFTFPPHVLLLPIFLYNFCYCHYSYLLPTCFVQSVISPSPTFHLQPSPFFLSLVFVIFPFGLHCPITGVFQTATDTQVHLTYHAIISFQASYIEARPHSVIYSPLIHNKQPLASDVRR